LSEVYNLRGVTPSCEVHGLYGTVVWGLQFKGSHNFACSRPASGTKKI
jgi:hypothetical protein